MRRDAGDRQRRRARIIDSGAPAANSAHANPMQNECREFFPARTNPNALRKSAFRLTSRLTKPMKSDHRNPKPLDRRVVGRKVDETNETQTSKP